MMKFSTSSGPAHRKNRQDGCRRAPVALGSVHMRDASWFDLYMSV